MARDRRLPAFPLADVMAGQSATAAVCAAYVRRLRTGEGEVIDFAIATRISKKPGLFGK